MKMRLVAVWIVFAVLCMPAFADPLRIHFMNVGQGDGAVLVSPGGEVVLFDNGVRNNCNLPLRYLRRLGIQQVDHHIASHYHDDHIGCTSEILGEIPLAQAGIAWDRGSSYHTQTYDRYVQTVGSKRRTASTTSPIILDGNTASPIKIEFVALNGNGITTDNENDLSVVAVVRAGNFDVVMGGDLSGYDTENYEDIETGVANLVGQVEVYKANHHCSRYSTNSTWIQKVKPKVAMISAGEGNVHGHPTFECLERLHQNGVTAYWTTRGNGGEPEPNYDFIGGDLVVAYEPGQSTFSVEFENERHEHDLWGGTPATPVTTAFVWSRHSDVYHHSSCRYVLSISARNRREGSTPAEGKDLHLGCPSP